MKLFESFAICCCEICGDPLSSHDEIRNEVEAVFSNAEETEFESFIRQREVFTDDDLVGSYYRNESQLKLDGLSAPKNGSKTIHIHRLIPMNVHYLQNFRTVQIKRGGFTLAETTVKSLK